MARGAVYLEMPDSSFRGTAPQGAMANAAPDDITLVRQTLTDDYEIVEEIGRGGMAVVYRAREWALDRDVAIKVLPPSRAMDPDLVERFQREARTAARLEHPNIVPIYHVGHRGTVIFFVMKLLRGQSVGSLLKQQGTLRPVEIRRILQQTASALGYAARCGIVHRDVKPDNIVLDHDGRCIVTDFGIARSMSSTRLTAAGTSVGTPRYMSPEQARGQEVDGRSDIYSLGVVAYECLVGRPPFEGDDPYAVLFGHIQSPVPRPRLASDEERALFRVIERMLAKRPEDRYRDADELIAALDRSASHSSASSSTVPVPRPDLETTATLPSVGTGVRDSRSRAAAFMTIARRGGTVVREALRRAVVLSRARSRRFWMSLAASVVGLVMLYEGAYFAVMHHSRCPVPAAATGAGPRALTLLVDAIGMRRAGKDLDVYYDVCGLADGTDFTTRIAVVKNESGLRRLIGGGVDPITVDYSETASGPATRRHRTLDFGAMPPGSYTLRVVITDHGGRRREKALEFQVMER